MKTATQRLYEGIIVGEKNEFDLEAALERAVQHGRELEHERRFPIQGGPSVPWRLVAPFEWQAKRNHDQTLEELARRGGLSPSELMCLVQNRGLFPHPSVADGLAFVQRILVEDDRRLGRIEGLREALSAIESEAREEGGRMANPVGLLRQRIAIVEAEKP